MRLPTEIVHLFAKLDAPADPVGSGGISQSDLAAFRLRTGLELPAELVAWLEFRNGANVPPGGVYGIRPDHAFIDIESTWRLYPTWRDRRWIPMASDGCGNYYVVLSAPEGARLDPVLFVDTIADVQNAACIVASGFLRFLWFLFDSELNTTRWPCDRDFVVAHDPEILNVPGFRFAWEA